ncbi:AraC family transcriptional regulator ligand-binding domain-containing protein [Streptomyces sp. NPDC047108]|uniref:AraC family transcriptional regulator n=1 Tax=Streptomyces sp. NPDC047108 TaxID=3155025 RepID=UPI0033C5F8C2
MRTPEAPTVAAAYANAVISNGAAPEGDAPDPAGAGDGDARGQEDADARGQEGADVRGQQGAGVRADARVYEGGAWASSAERLPFSEVRRVWDRVLGPTEQPHTGLRIGYALQPSALHVLGHLVLTCTSLAEAAAQAVRYLPLVSEAGALRLERGARRSRLVYRPSVPEGAMHPQQVEAVVAASVTAARWIAGRRWAPAAVAFTHARIGDLAPYERILRCPVSFGAERNTVTVATPELDLVRGPGDPELAALHRAHADRLLSGLAAPVTVRQRVRGWLDQAPLDRVGPEDVQEALHLSERTLRRLLREEGTCWSDLLDAARHDRARRLLASTDRTLERIAHELGLSGAPAFVRAFTRWEGTTPGSYRRGLTAP